MESVTQAQNGSTAMPSGAGPIMSNVTTTTAGLSPGVIIGVAAGGGAVVTAVIVAVTVTLLG